MNKDCWKTPEYIIKFVANNLYLHLDVAAASHNAVCSLYYTEQNNALNLPWLKYGNCWCNPPYSEIGKWVSKAINEHTLNQNKEIIMLVPNSTDSVWFKAALDYGAHISYFINGRIQFVHYLTGEQSNNNTKGSILIHFGKNRIFKEYLDIKKIKEQFIK